MPTIITIGSAAGRTYDLPGTTLKPVVVAPQPPNPATGCSVLNALLQANGGGSVATDSQGYATITGKNTGSTFWGDNIYGYTSDSDFSQAVVHAGLLAPGETQKVKFTSLGKKAANFPGYTQNGVTSTAWTTSAWCAIQLSLDRWDWKITADKNTVEYGGKVTFTVTAPVWVNNVGEIQIMFYAQGTDNFIDSKILKPSPGANPNFTLVNGTYSFQVTIPNPFGSNRLKAVAYDITGKAITPIIESQIVTITATPPVPKALLGVFGFPDQDNITGFKASIPPTSHTSFKVATWQDNSGDQALVTSIPYTGPWIDTTTTAANKFQQSFIPTSTAYVYNRQVFNIGTEWKAGNKVNVGDSVYVIELSGYPVQKNYHLFLITAAGSLGTVAPDFNTDIQTNGSATLQSLGSRPANLGFLYANWSSGQICDSGYMQVVPPFSYNFLNSVGNIFFINSNSFFSLTSPWPDYVDIAEILNPSTGWTPMYDQRIMVGYGDFSVQRMVVEWDTQNGSYFIVRYEGVSAKKYTDPTGLIPDNNPHWPNAVLTGANRQYQAGVYPIVWEIKFIRDEQPNYYNNGFIDAAHPGVFYVNIIQMPPDF